MAAVRSGSGRYQGRLETRQKTNAQLNIMRIKKKLIRHFVTTLFLLGIYPLIILSYVWYCCYTSGFQWGRHGQLDAYRHTLASAVTAYAISPKAVYLITELTEYTRNPADLMDRHNNKIGLEIAERAKSFSEINKIVTKAVLKGSERAKDENQITWLPPVWWQKGLFW